MKDIKLKTLILFLLFPLFKIYGQTYRGVEAALKVPTSQTLKYVTPHELPTYIQFKKNEQINIKDFPAFIKKVFKLKHESIRLKSQFEDNKGFIHYKFQEYCNGIKVEGGEYIAHTKDGKVLSANGYLFKIKEELSNVQTLQKADLVYIPKDFDYKNKKFQLTQKIVLQSEETFQNEVIYRNVNNGKIVAQQNLIRHIAVPSTGTTLYDGVQNFMSDSIGIGQFRLREYNTRGDGIETYNMNNQNSRANASDFFSASSNWDFLMINQDPVAIAAHWSAEKVYDYFKEKHNRNGIDGNDMIMKSYVHTGVDLGGAYWNNDAVFYGDGNPNSNISNPTTSFDICAHEWTHGIIEYSAGLINVGESGALNESFCDIFASSMDFWCNTNTANWQIGEAITQNNIPFRDMSNPNSLAAPDTYQGNFWGGINDVHQDASVQNYWYYLLVNGGSGINDNNDVYTINGIGLEKAEQIVYRSLTTYLTSISTYEDAREAAILAASDLFGGCSMEVVEVTNAWYAVGVGAEYEDLLFVDFDAIQRQYCDAPAQIEFINLSGNASAYFWHFGDGFATSPQVHPTYTYNETGTYGVNLLGYGCSNETKSVYKEFFVEIDPDREVCQAEIMPVNGPQLLLNCEGILADNGGLDGKYDNNINATTTIYPIDASQITLVIEEFETENQIDYLSIYDGIDDTAPLLGTYFGSNVEGTTITSSDGVVTLKFVSDGSIKKDGFKIHWFCSYAQPPTASFTTDANCQTILFENESTYGISYEWDFGDGNRSTLINPEHTYDSAGTYVVGLTTYNNVGTVTTTENLIVTSDSLSANLSFPDTVDINDTTQFFANSFNAVSWSWDFGQGYGTVENPVFIYTQDGLYNVRLTLTNASGCTRTFIRPIFVDGAVGIENPFEYGAFKLFPNPTRDKFMVHYKGKQEKIKLSLYTILGKQLYQEDLGELTTFEKEINVEYLPRGVYLLKIESVTHQRTEKIIIN